MDKIKSALIYILGGVGSLVVVLQLFVWMSPASRAQEADGTGQMIEADGTGQMIEADEPEPGPEEDVDPDMANELSGSQMVPPAPVQAAPAPAVPVPTAPASPMQAPTASGATLADGVQVPQADDFLAPYIFDTREGRRNPFRPMMLKDDDSDRAAIGPATPLERYDIDELKLVAIMWDVKSPRAMIMDPNKEIHMLGKDDRLGRRQGYIATIREGELVVVETADFNGEVIYSTRVMRIEK